MRQRVNIEDLEQSTKIRAKYLRALENEEFGLLPGPTYVKSFLRTYAEKLGLDPQLLVEEFRAKYEPPEPVEFQPIALAAARPPPAPSDAALRARRGDRASPWSRCSPSCSILGLTGGEDEPERTVDSGPAKSAARKPEGAGRPRRRRRSASRCA